MNSTIAQQLPAGMIDSQIVIFAAGNKQYYFTDGIRRDLSEAPDEIKNAIKEHQNSRPTAVKALLKKGVTDPEEQLLVYARCVCGGYQGKPDIVDGKLVGTEYWDCGIRGKCDIEGELCCSAAVGGQIIGARELELCRWIASGLPDKIIGVKMNISENTINPMKRSIAAKIGGISKVDITRFFMANNFRIYDNG